MQTKTGHLALVGVDAFQPPAGWMLHTLARIEQALGVTPPMVVE